MQEVLGKLKSAKCLFYMVIRCLGNLEEKGFKGEQVADLRAQWMRHERKRKTMLGAGSHAGKEKKGWTMFAGDFIVEKEFCKFS